MLVALLNQLGWVSGLVAFICMALLGQAELIMEPYRHYVTVTAIIATAFCAYMLQHPPKPWDGTERRGQDNPSKE